MGQIGMDISVEELRRQFSDAVERLAEMRADLDQATQEVTRLREELKTTREWAENFAHTATDNGAARDRYKKELEALQELYKKADRDATSSADQAMHLRDQLEEVEKERGLHWERARKFKSERDKLHAELVEAREQYATLEKGLSEGMAQRAEDKLHQETLNVLVGEFAGDAEKIEKAEGETERLRGLVKDLLVNHCPLTCVCAYCEGARESLKIKGSNK